MENNEELKKLDFEVTKDDFVFVQQDAKIHDKKFETKPTTFIKDAFRRFCKNKSSVVGAIILGIIILLAIFVPWISQKDIKTSHPTEAFLPPKLFAAGKGFWDGTRKYSHIVYDTESEAPADFVKRAVLMDTLVVDEVEYVNSVNKYGHNGYVAFINENENIDTKAEGFDYKDSLKGLYFAEGVNFKATDETKVNLVFSNDQYLNTVRTVFKITIKYNNTELDLTDWISSRNDLEINISEKMQEAGIASINNGIFNIYLKAGNKSRSSLLIKSIVFESNGTNKEKLDEYSFTEANDMLMRVSNVERVDPGCWKSTGQKNAYKVEIYRCSFTYDPYEVIYGKQELVMPYSGTSEGTVSIERLILDGQITFEGLTVQDGKITITKRKDELKEAVMNATISEDSIIEEIISVKTNPITGKLQELKATYHGYHQLKYKSMPNFLFGTDAQGKDIFKLAFSGLRTSLIIGVITAAFCFIFGLIWGSISGYFGGNVDLFMERFCDILSGIPWIVVMTLVILHFGQTFGVFILALCMTGWMGTAGRTRTQFYRFKGREYVLASRTLGASDIRLIFRHILPNALGTIVTGAVLMIPSVIFSEANISYLGLGFTNLDSFGVMLSSNQRFIENYPNLIVFPAVIMSLMMISFNLFGNGLRDALNPSLKGGEM